MTDKHKPSPNTYLGDIWFYACPVGGNLGWIVQDLLGMSARPPDQDGFLDTKTRTFEELWDLVDIRELTDGRLALELHEYNPRMFSIAFIETNFRYQDELDGTITTEQYMMLLADFVAAVRSMPLVDSNSSEGAEFTKEDIERMTRHETLEEHDFWASLPSWVKTEPGLPHYLWLESLEHQTED